MNRLLPSFLFFTGLLLAAAPGRAQSSAYTFDLTTEKLEVPAGPWQITRVLDLRADRSRLGTVHRGMGNEVVSADFTRSLAPELLQFLRAQMPAQAGARPVVMRVLTLALSEDIRTASENAEAELIADFLEPLPDSTFHVLLTVGETSRRCGMDVTKFHAANLALVLQQGLRQLAALPAALPTAEVLSRADALAGRGGAWAPRQYAIQTAAAPKRGFYHSLQEFRNNAPSEPSFPFAVTHIPRPGKRWAGTDEVQVNYLSTDNAHPNRPVSTSGIWGLSDGNEVLIAYRNHFYKLLPAVNGRDYTFMGPPVFDAQAAARGAMLGGLAGLAIANAATSAGLMAPYEVHLASGRVVPDEAAAQADANGFATTSDSARVYVYRRDDGAADQAISFSAAGQPATPLRVRQWTALTWRDRRQDLKLCVRLGAAEETCRAFVPDFSQPTYLECVVPAGGGPAVLRSVSAKEGLFELRRIQRLAKAGK